MNSGIPQSRPFVVQFHPVAEDDYESFWNTIRPQRGQAVERPEPEGRNPCAEIPIDARDHELPRSHGLGLGFNHDAAIRNLELPNDSRRIRDEARARIEQQLGRTLSPEEVERLAHLTNEELASGGFSPNFSISQGNDLFVPDFEGPDGNMVPRSEFQRQAILRMRVWLGEVRRHLPQTTTARALFVRAGDTIRSNVGEYSSQPGATMDGVDTIIQHELEPVVALIQQTRRSATNQEMERIWGGDNPVPPASLEELVAQVLTLGHSLQRDEIRDGISQAIQQQFEASSEDRVPSPTTLAIRRRLGTGLTTEELLTQVLNEVHPPSPVAQAVQQERRVQELVDRVDFTTRFATTWMNPDQGPPQLVALVRAFRDLGIAVDTHLQLNDEPGASTLTLVIDDQTIRLECEGGHVHVRVFDPLSEITSL